ncbi:hypothetical protein WCP94_003066 [Bilophila wadsworthia]
MMTVSTVVRRSSSAFFGNETALNERIQKSADFIFTKA